MITDAIIRLGGNMAVWILGLFPSWDPPEWMKDPLGPLNSWVESMYGVGVWVDWKAVGICLTAVIAAYGVGLTIRLVRAAMSHVPLIGGGG